MYFIQQWCIELISKYIIYVSFKKSILKRSLAFTLKCISAVKQLIAINHIQIKSFSLHNICVIAVYIYYIKQNYKRNTFVFAPISQRSSMHTKGLFLSNIVHKSV